MEFELSPVEVEALKNIEQGCARREEFDATAQLGKDVLRLKRENGWLLDHCRELNSLYELSMQQRARLSKDRSVWRAIALLETALLLAVAVYELTSR